MTSVAFGTQSPAIPHLSTGEVADLRRDVEAAFATLEGMGETGQVASAALLFATNPTTGNTVTIGSDVYEFGGVGANINVDNSVDVATTKANFVTAINTLGSELVKAVADTPVAAAVNIFAADAVGGNPVAGAGPDIALAETLTDAADVWNQANLNATGGDAGAKKMTSGSVAITALNLATAFNIECGFTVDDVLWAAYDASGAPKVTTAQVTPDGTGILIDADAGATALVATDVVKWVAWGAA